MIRQQTGKDTSLIDVLASYSKIRQAFQRHFFCMARTSQNSDVLFGHPIHFIEVVRNNQVFVGHNTFDCRDDELILKFCFQLFEVSFQVWRRSNEYQRIRLFHHLIYIRREIDTLQVKAHTRQVSRVMA